MALQGIRNLRILGDLRIREIGEEGGDWASGNLTHTTKYTQVLFHVGCL
ncbi:unnamed protein product [Spodoptera littoralis]|uniref:Uncharacterized protein n=1 Tax=Spodoptera littoralis TaxID=7109 RepID=A0A9P0I3M7_SPOLI|nr:unnamed protein product [Spodoptera littoralis]CAH1639596.1 unnamed protein product [Spodoptera littoralis]